MLCMYENFRNSLQRCSVKKYSYKFSKINKKTLVPEFLFQ